MCVLKMSTMVAKHCQFLRGRLWIWLLVESYKKVYFCHRNVLKCTKSPITGAEIGELGEENWGNIYMYFTLKIAQQTWPQLKSGMEPNFILRAAASH